ncbi:hypothetical protein, partial [Spirosoma harenae]
MIYRKGPHALMLTDMQGKPLNNTQGKLLYQPDTKAYSRILDKPFENASTQTLCEGGNLAFGLYYWPLPSGYTQEWFDPTGKLGQKDANWDIQNIKPAQAGNYTYKVTDNNGCVGTAQVLVNVTPTSYNGRVDEVSCTKVRGWLANGSCQDRSSKVRILIDGVVVDTIWANQSRPDIRQYVLGRTSGYDQYGYEWLVPAQYRQGTHTVAVTDMRGNPLGNSSTGQPTTSLGGATPKTYVIANGNPFTVGTAFTVCQDSPMAFGMDHWQVPGYIMRWKLPDGTITPDNRNVEIKAIKQSGVYTYIVTDPTGCINSAQVTVTVTPASYNGTFGEATCTNVTGWLVNYNCQDQSSRVRVLLDGVVVDTIWANQSRPDVRQIVLGRTTGYDQYGFNWTVPMIYRKGPHALMLTDMQGKSLNNMQGRMLYQPDATPYSRILNETFTSASTQTLCEADNIAFGLHYWPLENFPGYKQEWFDPAGNLGITDKNWEIKAIKSAQGGYYTYKVTDNNGCVGTSRVLVNVTPASYNGRVDEVSCTKVRGWLSNATCQERPSKVRILMDGVVIDTITTNQSRPDIRQYVLGRTTGFDQYGYEWLVPAQFKTGLHTVVITDMQGAPLGNSSTGQASSSLGSAPPQTYVIANGNPFTIGTQFTVCQGSSMAFGLDHWPVPAGYIQRWKLPDGTITPDNRNVDILAVNQGGTYTCMVTDPAGCVNSTQVQVTLKPAPSAPTPIRLNGGASNTFCAGTGVLLTGQCPSGTPLWTYINGPVPGAGSTSTNASIGHPGQYPVGMYRYSLACQQAGCTGPAQVVDVVIFSPPAPSPIRLNGGTSSTFCAGTGIVLTGQCPSGTPVWTYVNGPVPGAGSISTDAIIGHPGYYPAGTYRYSLACQQNGCTGPAQIADIIILNLPVVSIAGNLTACQSTSLTASGASTYGWSTGATTPTISASASGPYSVTGRDAYGCSTISTVNVQILSLPTSLSLSAQLAGTSTAQSLTLTATGCPAGSTVRWSGPANTSATGSSWIISSFTQTSNYSAYCQAGTGCAGALTTLNVPFNAPPAPIIRTNRTSLCSGDSVT